NSWHYWIDQVLGQGILKRRLFVERSMSGVLSGGVEFSRFGGRPLVRVYSRHQMRRLLSDAGFVDVTTDVRHFRPSDTSITRPVAGISLRAMSIDIPPVAELPRALAAAADDVRAYAQDALEHRFDVLGSGGVDLGPEIDWHADFKSGYVWPAIFYLDLGTTRL